MRYSIIRDSEKIELRNKFIKNFIDTEHEYYKKNIAKLKEYLNGFCFNGYLWDVLNEPYDSAIMTQENALEYLKQKDMVLVMWDIDHNHGIICLNNPKDTIISVKAEELCDLIEYEWNADHISEDTYLANRYLPEDIYIFDDTMKWCVIFTHEGDDKSTKPELVEDEYIRDCFVIDRTK